MPLIIDSTEKCLCPECKKGIKACGVMRRILPGFMVPYKHYEEEAITDVLDEVITEESPVDFPSVQTMRHWKAWLLFNLNRIEGIFRNIGYTVLCFSEELLFYTGSLLEQLRMRTDRWLTIIFLLFLHLTG